MRRISDPFKKFIQLETSSSIILFTVSIFAVLWANSSYGYLYEDLWHHKFTIGFADTNFHLAKPLILWINDGLMAIFFFVIGLYILVISDSFNPSTGYRQVKMYTPTKVMWSKNVPNDSTEWFGFGSYNLNNNELVDVFPSSAKLFTSKVTLPKLSPVISF